MTASGIPNEAIRPCEKASMTDDVVISVIGIARGQRVRRSTAVRRCLYPLETGSVTMSMFQCWNRFAGTTNSPILFVERQYLFNKASDCDDDVIFWKLLSRKL